jgi:WD40 repeat protein
VWDAQSGKALGQPFKLEGVSKTVTSVAYSSNGKEIVSACEDNTVQTWDAKSGVAIREGLGDHRFNVGENSINFSPDRTHWASLSNSNCITIYSGGDKFVLNGHSGVVTCVAFSADSKRLVSGSKDNTVRLWDIARRVELCPAFQGHTDSVISVAFSPNGTRIVSGAEDKTIFICNIESGTSTSQINSSLIPKHCLSQNVRRTIFLLRSGRI